jgi:hypothetical protein
MSGIIVLILRILLALSLYVFLAWAIYTIWRDLRLSGQILSTRKVPELLLQVLEPGTIPVTFSQPEIIIGRSTDCDLCIPNEAISARHLRLSFHHNQWWAEDLHSRNGSLLNEEKLITPTVIISDDEICCGTVNLHITIKL